MAESSNSNTNRLETEIVYLKISIMALKELITSTSFGESHSSGEDSYTTSRKLFSQSDIDAKEAEIKQRDEVKRMFQSVGHGGVSGVSDLDTLYALANDPSSESCEWAKQMLQKWYDEGSAL